ncbi:MAG: prepilin peptidase [Patescibacteria group bacterium]
MNFFLFILGSAVGSFLNVVALRYKPDKFLFGRQILGRSHCPHCRHKLSWFELVPLLSFAFQLGRCRNCQKNISWRYPIVEIISGLIFVFIPLALFSAYLLPTTYYLLSFLWVFIFSVLLLVALIDLRLSIIPDEVHTLLLVAGAGLTYLERDLALFERSFLGSYSLIFGFGENIWTNHIIAAIVGGLIFGFVIFVTRGRGMGMGDLKLAIPLGFIFGWPDIFVLIGLSFVVGALVGVYVILFRHLHFKSAIPFGPFLVAGSALVFFFGKELADFYFGLFPV